jgi:hypothetical protein
MKSAANTIITSPTSTTSDFITMFMPLNPDEATGVTGRDDIYLSLTKEVAVRHNGKTDRNRTKSTTGNVLQ